jgi:hypothetical protein
MRENGGGDRPKAMYRQPYAERLYISFGGDRGSTSHTANCHLASSNSQVLISPICL